MKKPIFIAAMVFCAIGTLTAAHAQNTKTTLGSEKISQIAGNVYEDYMAGGVRKILSSENYCWKDAARKPINSDTKKIKVAECAAAAVTGGVIETAYAREEMRGSHPQYTGEAIRSRIFLKSGLSKDETTDILSNTRDNIDSIILGLAAAGMQ